MRRPRRRGQTPLDRRREVDEASGARQRAACRTRQPTRSGERADGERARQVDGAVDAHQRRPRVARFLSKCAMMSAPKPTLLRRRATLR